MFDNPIIRATAKLVPILAALSPEALAKVEATAILDSGEWFAFGDKASLALLHNIISADSAQTLYAIHSHFQNTATLAERVVYMQAMSEILPLLREAYSNV